MRMRRRTNADERLRLCGDYYIDTTESEMNFALAVRTKDYLDFEKIFGNTNPVVAEIGCGQGFFACEYAKSRPDVNVLAIERISNVILTGVEKAFEEKIPNVRFLRVRAELLPKYLPPQSISGLFLNFSTPLPKKGYEKQRLTSRRNLEVYKTFLKSGAFLEQKTDDRDFFEFSLGELSESGFEITEKIYDLHASGKDNIVTEYESKFVSLGLPIYFLAAIYKEK